MLKSFMKYTQLADGKMITIFMQDSPIPEKAIFLFSHLLNAQHAWACRILGENPLYEVWENHHPSAYAKISALNFELLEKILDTVEMDREITYTNTKGNQFVGVVKDILLHVFNHSTYHRGQIAALLKAGSINPPITDYIMLKREGEL